MRNLTTPRTLWLTALLALGSSHLYADCASPAGVAGQLQYNGTGYQFCNGTVWTVFSTGGGGAPTGAAGGDLSGTYPNPTITGLDAAKVSTGVVSNTEYNFLDGVTSALQTQLNGKEATVTAGTTTQYYRGDKSWQTLNTTAVAEGTNLYFTDARTRAAALTGLSTATSTDVTASDSVLSAIGKLQAKSTATNTTLGTAFVQNGNNFGGAATLGTDTAHSLNLETNDTARITVLSDGKVGVGLSPTYHLDVQGSTGTPFRVLDSSSREYIKTATRTAGGVTAPIVSLADERLIIDNTGPDGGNDSILRRKVNNLFIYPSDWATGLRGNFIVTQEGGGWGFSVNQETGGNALFFPYTGGNVGIGKPNPATKLDVVGTVSATGLRVVDGNQGTGKVLTSDASGNATWQVGGSAPIGSLLLVSGSLPSGYLWANGQAVSRTTYASLFAAIGTAYGAGDGSTTFNLPLPTNPFSSYGTYRYYRVRFTHGSSGTYNYYMYLSHLSLQWGGEWKTPTNVYVDDGYGGQMYSHTLVGGNNVSLSSSYGTAYYLYDSSQGNYLTYYNAFASTSPYAANGTHYYQFDFGSAPVAITGFRIASWDAVGYYAHLTGYLMEASNNGTTWITVSNSTFTNSDTRTQLTHTGLSTMPVGIGGYAIRY